MKKILLVTESYWPNIDGGAIAQHNLVTNLSERGHDVRVIAPGESLKNKVENEKGVHIYRTRAVTLPLYMESRYNFSPFPLFKVRNVIKKFKPDVIHVCSPYPLSISALIYARGFGIPVLGSIHLLPENMLSPFFRLEKKYYDFFVNYSWRYIVYFFNLVDLATIPTQTGADMYKEHGLTTDISAISNGLKTELFNSKNDGEYLREKFSLPDKNIVLCTGRINEEKNLDVLIKAIPHVISKVDAHFLIVGEGGDYKKGLIKLAKDLDVFDHTTFTGFIDWDDYPNVYGLADVFALPSEAELQSIVTLEAVGSGLPVVLVNKGALPELACNDNGFVFEPKNSKQMASHIVKLLEDDKLREGMGKKSLELIKRHSMNSVVSEYEKVYEKLIDGDF